MMVQGRATTATQVVAVFLCLMVLAMSGTVVSAAPTSQGSATAAFLKLDPSAESAGAGSAYVGRSNELSAYFNPAGLSDVDETRAVMTENEIFAGITYRYLSVATRHEALNGGLALSVSNLDYGSQDRTRVSGDNPVTGLGQFSAGDLAFIASYGGRLTERLSVGSNLKYVQSQIAGFQDGTFTGDMGLHLNAPVRGLQFGLAARNLFGGLKLNRRRDPLPREFEFGTNYNYRWSPGYHEFQFGFGIGTARDSDEYFFSGITYELYKVGSFRVGHNGSQEAGEGFTFGFGLNYAGVKIDYAFVPFGDLGHQQRFTLNIGFGGSAEKDSGKKSAEPAPDREESELTIGREANLYKAIQFYEESQYEESRAILRRLRREYPDNIDILLRLGQVNRNLDNTELAKKQLKRVLELDPDNTQAKEILSESRPSAEAQSIDALLEKGEGLYKNNKFKMSRDVLLKARDRAQQHIDVLYWLAKAEYELGYESLARKRLLRVLEFDPANMRARTALLKMN